MIWVSFATKGIKQDGKKVNKLWNAQKWTKAKKKKGPFNWVFTKERPCILILGYWNLELFKLRLNDPLN